MTLDLENINVILATDCGSTTTKAILIEKVDGTYRQTFIKYLKKEYRH
jgi:activator of 2-hydroxyglutaryl-CoA dehydratase